MRRSDHYETLGVSSEASAAEIREAYLRLARQQHPDRLVPGSPVRLDSMAEINEAYRVLSDPGRRAVYDATVRNVGSAVPPSGRSGAASSPSADAWADPDDPAASGWARHSSQFGPARVPWRMLLFCGTLAVVGVVVLAQFTNPSEPRGPDGILRVGDCVAYEANGDAREVPCVGNSERPAPEDRVIVAFVPFDATCPGLTEPHRDRQGMGIACVPIAD